MTRLTEPLAKLLVAPFGDWLPLIDTWRHSTAGRHLMAELDARVARGTVVFPAQVFRALHLTPLTQTRVVILGQDPYHSAGQAEGLAFSVPPGVRIPPSLRNVFKELQRDLGLAVPSSGPLEAWARQGVLLLNTWLTVEEGRPASHAKLGWRALTDEIIKLSADDPAPKVFMLWGSHAQSLAPLVQRADGRHLVLMSNHPSPLSAARPPCPFVGNAHFSQASRFLRDAGRGPIDWALA